VRVLVTGGLGFIGSTLAHALAGAGSDVLIVDRLVPQQGGRPENIAGIDERVEVVHADVRDEGRLRELVAGQEVVFSLAGQTSHIDSMSDPYADLEYNCRAPLAVLEACRHSNPECRIVFASTRQLYGRPRYLPADEQHPLAPVDVNGVNKLAGEWYHLVYSAAYGIPMTVLRLTNTYGPRMRVKDARQTFLGVWLRQLIRGEALTIFGDGTQLRDFNFVDDAVRALLMAAADDRAAGEIYNLGGDRVVSLLELAQLLVEISGEGTYELVEFPPDRKAIDIGDYYADYGKIREALGWEPRVPLEEGLARSLAFYRDHGEAYWAVDA
jgi:UDP-glucose 4-epimerase